MAPIRLAVSRLLVLGAGLGSLGALAGCAGTPQADAALNQARTEVAAATNDPHVVALAAPQLQMAQSALEQSDAALRNGDMMAVDHYAYLATRYAGTAEQTAKLKVAQQVVANAPAARSAALVGAARGEAARAESAAQSARQQAEASAQQQQQATADEQRMRRQIAELKAKQTPQGLVVTPRDILFKTGSAELQPNARNGIERIARFLRGNPDRKVLVEGFTDSTGSAALNQQLSQQRADAVRLALANDGVDQSRIEIRGMGPAQPIASNDSRSGRLINRRVRILISNANGGMPAAASGSSQP